MIIDHKDFKYETHLESAEEILGKVYLFLQDGRKDDALTEITNFYATKRALERIKGALEAYDSHLSAQFVTTDRVQRAEQLLQDQKINAEQYISLIHTGNLEQPKNEQQAVDELN